jgi:quercetin dioxygenase-like cupin family protein
MKAYNISEMIGGWFVGGFDPAALKVMDCEVALKKYKAGATEVAHFHRVATEVTLVVSGQVRMCNKEWSEGDIIVLSPGEITEFEAITDAVNVVVKVPGVLNDKYLV